MADHTSAVANPVSKKWKAEMSAGKAAISNYDQNERRSICRRDQLRLS
jgi:hypothetical protein